MTNRFAAFPGLCYHAALKRRLQNGLVSSFLDRFTRCLPILGGAPPGTSAVASLILRHDGTIMASNNRTGP